MIDFGLPIWLRDFVKILEAILSILDGFRSIFRL